MLRLATLWVEQCRSAAGVRKGVTLGDWSGSAYYKELSSERLARALSPRGQGHKSYRVTFPDGSKLVIQCSRQRLYADLVGPEGLARYQRLANVLRPGMRVLEIAAPPMHTGYTTAWLTRAAAPEGGPGGVVSINPDEQAVRFAGKRYALPNMSIEHEALSPLNALIGETDGAFDVAVCVGLPGDASARVERVDILKEVWRVLAVGGWLLAGTGMGEHTENASAIRDDVRALPGAQLVEPDQPGPFADVLVHKTETTRP